MEDSTKIAIVGSITYCTAIWYYIKKAQKEREPDPVFMHMMNMTIAAGVFTAGTMMCGGKDPNGFLISGICASTVLWYDLLI